MRHMAPFICEWPASELQSKEAIAPQKTELHMANTEYERSSPLEPALSRVETGRDSSTHKIFSEPENSLANLHKVTPTAPQSDGLALQAPVHHTETYDYQEEVFPLQHLSILSRPKIVRDSGVILEMPMDETAFGSAPADDKMILAHDVKDGSIQLEGEGTRISGRTSDDSDLRASNSPDSCNDDFASSPDFQMDSGEESFMFDSHSPLSFEYETQEEIGVQISQVAQGLVQDFFSEASGMVVCTPQSSEDSSVPSSSRQLSARASVSSAEQTCLRQKAEPGRKRRRAQGEDEEGGEEDEEEEGPNRRRCDTRTEGGTPAEGLLACPFAKFDPDRFSERNQDLNEKAYRRCGSACLTSIPRLKQHLYRVHRRPEHYCSSCFEIFETSEELKAHTRTRPSCEVGEDRFTERMSPEQEKAIKRRKIREDRVAGWFGIFQILFPAAQPPGDPYVSNVGPRVSMRAVHDFIEFAEREAPWRIAARIATPLFGDEYAEINRWYLGEVLEAALPIVLEELMHEQQDLNGRPGLQTAS